MCCFSFPPFSFEAEILKSLAMAVAPERGACWLAPLKPMAFLLGWRQAYPGGRREHICHHPAPRLAVLGSGWGSRFTLWQPLSPLPRRVYLVLFSLLKQQNNPHVTSELAGKLSCGKQAKGQGCFSPARQGYPNAWPPPPATRYSHWPAQHPTERFLIRASQPVAEGKNYLIFKNTEREKLSSGFLEILRQKNKHGSWKSVVVLKSLCQQIAVQNKKEQKLFIYFTSWCGA